MSGIVLDCSSVLAWFFEDERDDDALRLMDALAVTRAHVPSLWPYEIANAMLMAERHGRLKADTIAEGLSAMAALDIAVDPASAIANDLIVLARKYDLTVYDAAYLALALRLKIPLATRDKGLLRAARSAGAGLF